MRISDWSSDVCSSDLITELSEGPAAVSLEIVHARNPVVLHRRLLVFGVFAAIALDFDDEVQGIIVAIVYLHNEVRAIDPGLGAVAVGHIQSEVMEIGRAHV